MKINSGQFSSLRTALLRPPLLGALLTLFLHFSQGNSAGAATTIPIPGWMETSAVAEEMVINGVPSEVHHFSATRTVDQILAYYRLRWDDTSAGGKGFREADAGYWQIISRLEGDHLLTVQIREKDAFSSEGFLSVADLRSHEASQATLRVPKMEGSEILNRSSSRDGGRKGHSLLIVNGFSSDTNSNFYRDHYRSRGWGQVMDQGSDSARVLVFGRGHHTVHLVIHESGGVSRIVMNLVEE